MEVRTIFFNGPKGHRWVTHLVSTKAEIPYTNSTPPPDEKEQHRRCFFGSLNAMRSRLARHGATPGDVRKSYAKRFGVERMAQCTPQQWAIAAAEVQAMRESQEIFLDHISRFRRA